MSSAANVRYLVGIVSLSAFHRGTARTFLTKFANASAGIMAKLQYVPAARAGQPTYKFVPPPSMPRARRSGPTRF